MHVLTSLVLLLIMPVTAYSYEGINRSIDFPVSNTMSLIDAKQLALEQVQSEVLQEVGVFIKSEVQGSATNGKSNGSISFSQSTGAITKTIITNETYNGKTLSLSVTVYIDKTSLRDYLKNKISQSEIDTLSKNLHLLSLENDTITSKYEYSQIKNKSLNKKIIELKNKINDITNTYSNNKDLANKAESFGEKLLNLERHIKADSIDLNIANESLQNLTKGVDSLKENILKKRNLRLKQESIDTNNNIAEHMAIISKNKSNYNIVKELLNLNITKNDLNNTIKSFELFDLLPNEVHSKNLHLENITVNFNGKSKTPLYNTDLLFINKLSIYHYSNKLNSFIPHPYYKELDHSLESRNIYGSPYIVLFFDRSSGKFIDYDLAIVDFEMLEKSFSIDIDIISTETHEDAELYAYELGADPKEVNLQHEEYRSFVNIKPSCRKHGCICTNHTLLLGLLRMYTCATYYNSQSFKVALSEISGSNNSYYTRPLN